MTDIPVPKNKAQAEEMVKRMTAPHADTGLGQGTRKFKVERVMVQLNWIRRLWYLLAGGAIVMEVARAPQKVSGVEVLDLTLVSARQLRRLQQERHSEAERRPGPTITPKRDTRQGDEAFDALKAISKK